MTVSRAGLAALSLLALVAAGCQSERVSSLDTRPAPLTPAPAGTVTGNPLPPPATPAPAAFPEPPKVDPAAEQQLAANAPDVTTGSVAGVWNVSVGGQSCKVATPQTKYGQGYRAGPLRCPPPVDGVRSWNVGGKQLTLYDEGGGVLARLYSTGAEKFDGQTQSGMPISLTR